jgi:outer membrane assembly lipoprotein YfiO
MVQSGISLRKIPLGSCGFQVNSRCGNSGTALEKRLQTADGPCAGPPPKRWYEPVVIEDCRVALVALFLGVGSADDQNQEKAKKAYDLNANPLAGVQSKQPDKELYDKAMVAMKKGRYDVARLDLQTMLNTYPESEYRMRAKLSVGDTWFKEGGRGAHPGRAEYEDFITFFPNAPEAAEAKMKVADIYYQQMEKPDRDFTNAQQAEKEYREMINMFPDSTLIPRAKQKLRDVQEVLAEREYQIGLYYESREDYVAAIARLETVSDYLSALFQERPGAARHRRRLRRRGARDPDRSQPARRHQRALRASTRTRPPRPTPRSSRAIPWRRTLRMPATAWWP